ncbi:MAG TPA: SPW repeat protein [Rhodoblastus sp.]|nr:SPW repeat protein [Rhodoblastus sp.]
MTSAGAQPANRLDFLTLLIGIAFLVAPWALGYGASERATTSSIVAGLAIVACAIVALAELRHLFEEVDVALGVLAAAAPWLAGFASIPHAAAVHVVLGLAVAALSLGELWWERSHSSA